MNGSFVSRWDELVSSVWEPLGVYSSGVETAPADIYSSLYVTADPYLAPRPTFADLEAARNDADLGRTRFLALRGTDFHAEGAILSFLGEVGGLVSQYGPAYLAYYVRLLETAIDRYNMPYYLHDHSTIRLILPGAFWTLYEELRQANQRDGHLASLWDDLEASFDAYTRTQSDTDLKTSISKTTNYLEGLGGYTRGASGTLGALCDSLTEWPHAKVRDAVKMLYGFCSDYPGIRHGGAGGSVLRRLEPRDSVAINVSLVALAAYLTALVNGEVLLGGRPVGVRWQAPQQVTLSAPASKFDLMRRLRSLFRR